MKSRTLRILSVFGIFFFASCSISKQINRQVTQILLKDTAISTGHIGISIYEPATNKYWYNFNAGKYFIPASNTKLFTLYAGLKYLGDSLVAARLIKSGDRLTVYPTGDPTFLLSEFAFQPLYKTLTTSKNIYINISFWKSSALGNGWAWDDFNEPYMAERSALPIYGNVLQFSLKKDTINATCNLVNLLSDEKPDSPIGFNPETKKVSSDKFNIERAFTNNDFYVLDANTSFKTKYIPFKTDPDFIASILKDTLHVDDVTFFKSDAASINNSQNVQLLHSQPADSLFKPMMHRSDNFFAEQTLLMASNEHLGFMNTDKMIDTILNTDLSDIPQKPKWVDGSGLSRYNLFTPQSFVYILQKMKTEFGWPRMQHILATGGSGTLFNYYKKDSGYIFAKTGTLSNNCALSGYLITKKGKFLIFSVLANNYITAASPVRRKVEKFIEEIREKY